MIQQNAIAQVVTFALPHPKLGEEVAAAVVLTDGQETTERDIRDFAASRMAAFKVPQRVVILDEIPKGATGKMQRIGMAEKLGLVQDA
ncbi:MAG: AMP-dependent synthetase, partial [Pseudomonadota bacterium]